MARKAPPAEVERLARGLGHRLLAAYPVPLAPAAVPDLARGARLYAEHCASCHGATGAADTAMARQLDPPPIAFTDRGRARERSLFALYQVIEQGLEGTAMQSFAPAAAGGSLGAGLSCRPTSLIRTRSPRRAGARWRATRRCARESPISSG